MIALAKEVVNWFLVILVVMGFKSTFVDMQNIPSSSMNPSLETNDYILVNNMQYSIRVPFTSWSIFSIGKPERGDVVTFRNEDTKVRYIKRVVALGGDTISFDGIDVMLNGEKLGCLLLRGGEEQFYCKEAGRVVAHDNDRKSANGNIKAVFTVPENHVFVMGDNRDHSLDSRFLPSHFVHIDDIHGKAISKLFNMGSIRLGAFAIPNPFADGGDVYDERIYM